MLDSSGKLPCLQFRGVQSLQTQAKHRCFPGAGHRALPPRGHLTAQTLDPTQSVQMIIFLRVPAHNTNVHTGIDRRRLLTTRPDPKRRGENDSFIGATGQKEDRRVRRKCRDSRREAGGWPKPGRHPSQTPARTEADNSVKNILNGKWENRRRQNGGQRREPTRTKESAKRHARIVNTTMMDFSSRTVWFGGIHHKHSR